MAKLSWDPPKWKSYTLNESRFEVELENGEVYKGIKDLKFIGMRPNHPEVCLKIFGQSFAAGHDKAVLELSKVLDLNLDCGNWPEYHDIKEFLKRYYERVAKIKDSFTKSIISIESEIDITPKFTL